jgi:hypothetical protein
LTLRVPHVPAVDLNEVKEPAFHASDASIGRGTEGSI